MIVLLRRLLPSLFNCHGSSQARLGDIIREFFQQCLREHCIVIPDIVRLTIDEGTNVSTRGHLDQVIPVINHGIWELLKVVVNVSEID